MEPTARIKTGLRWLASGSLLLAATAPASAATGVTVLQGWAMGGFAIATALAAIASHRALRLARAEHAAAEYRAKHDSLTGIANRAAFMQRLDSLMMQGSDLAVVFLDLDGFKAINDSFGHDMGDDFLKGCTERLQQVIAGKPQCLLARVGGDEFAIAVPGPGARHAATQLAETITRSMSLPISRGGRDLVAGSSVGIACAATGVGAEELLKRADLAMYEAKRGGGSHWGIFDSRLAATRTRRERLAQAIRATIQEQADLPMLFEPVASAATHELTAARVSLGWPESMGEYIPASGIMEFAAEEGIGLELFLHVLERAGRDAGRLGKLRICVPMTASQLQNPSFDNTVEQMLIRTSADPRQLELMLPARQMHQLARRSNMLLLKRLTDTGITLNLTGFGHGASDISMLANSPYRRLTIHPSLTDAVATDANTQRLVQGITVIARAHGLEVGAEGVQSEVEARLLRLAGISEISGPQAGRPQSAETLIRMAGFRRADAVAG